MTHSISLMTSIDPDAERRRALVKVYDLLIRLAEEAEQTDAPAIMDMADEKIEEPAFTELAL